MRAATHRLGHAVQVNQKLGAVPCILLGCTAIAEHGRELVDVGSGAECPISIAGDDKTSDAAVIVVRLEHVEDLVVHLIVEGVHRLWPAERNDHDTVDIVYEHMAAKVEIAVHRLRRLWHTRPFAHKALHDALDFGRAQLVHQRQRPLLEAQGGHATEVEILGGGDVAIEDVE